MRDADLRRLLTDANPWWRSAASGDPVAWASDDRLLRDRLRHDLGYRPSILSDIAEGPVTDVLTLLRGPRRVGKSVVLRDLVVTLCARPDIDGRQVVHVPCDGLRPADLTRSLVLGRDLTRSIDSASPARRIWLFDEIGSVAGWTPVLKRARDNTAFGDDTVVATSSSWRPDENVQGQLLAGRAGTGPQRRLRILMPMSFRSFLAATRPSLARLDAVHPAHLQTSQTAGRLSELEFDLDAYDLAWQEYLGCGGFPRAVAEQDKFGAPSRGYLEDLSAWLQDDVVPDEPANSLPHLLSSLEQRSTSPLNQSGLARDLGYSRDAMTRRLTRLTNTFAVLTCPQRADRDEPVAGAAAKHYLTDPLLAWLPTRLRSGLPAPELSRLSEQALAVAMARTADELQAGRWVNADTIGYSRTGSGNEVDLCPITLPTSTGSALSVPIESKWVEQGWRSQARTIEGRFGRGIVATKSILDLKHPSWAVPAPLLAMLLGEA